MGNLKKQLLVVEMKCEQQTNKLSKASQWQECDGTPLSLFLVDSSLAFSLLEYIFIYTF